jgi:hypothetical protein
MKEELYKSMVKNLMKKNNFLNLSWLLDQGQMTEDDFQIEIDTNPDLYVIETNGEVNTDIIISINEILSDLNLQLSVDEVSELFSINYENLLEMLRSKEDEEEPSEVDATNN